MKMFLTRIGFGCQVIITGDSTQKDLPSGTISGLDVAVKAVKDLEGINICTLTSKDVVDVYKRQVVFTGVNTLKSHIFFLYIAL